jgi:predicted N-acyltransferase
VQTEIFESIDQIDPLEWDRLAPGRSFADWRWLQVTEALLLDYQPRYVLLRREGSLQAGAVCSLQRRFHSRLMQSAMGWFLRRFPSMRCDVPISYSMGLFFSDQGQIATLFPELLQGMQAILKQERVSFYSFDHLAPVGPAPAYLQAHGYHQFDHFLDANLDICWASFEDYLENLPKKENEETVQTQEYLEQQGITINVSEPLAEDLTALQRLVNDEIQKNLGFRVYREDVLLRASTRMGKDFKLILARHGGQAIGCVAMLRSANDWIARWPVLDSAHTLDTRVYDGLLAECIRQAILSRGQRLGLGGLDYRAMQHFGLRAEKRVGAIAVRNRPFHWLAGRIRHLTANRYAEQSPENISSQK